MLEIRIRTDRNANGSFDRNGQFRTAVTPLSSCSLTPRPVFHRQPADRIAFIRAFRDSIRRLVTRTDVWFRHKSTVNRLPVGTPPRSQWILFLSLAGNPAAFLRFSVWEIFRHRTRRRAEIFRFVLHIVLYLVPWQPTIFFKLKLLWTPSLGSFFPCEFHSFRENESFSAILSSTVSRINRPPGS